MVWGGLDAVCEVEADDTRDDDGDAQELPPRELLVEKEGRCEGLRPAVRAVPPSQPAAAMPMLNAELLTASARPGAIPSALIAIHVFNGGNVEK